MKLTPAMRLKFSFTVFLVSILLASCTKETPKASEAVIPEGVETFPIANPKLKGCRFKDPKPVYSFGVAIPPNPIICEEGVAKKVEKLTPASLPEGITFSNDVLSLTGTANEHILGAGSVYEFYLENEAGYTIIKIQISIP